MATGATRVVLGRGTYQATQIGDELLLVARGVHPTTGFQEFFEVLEPGRKFAFFFVKPGGIVSDVITPFQHHERFRVEGRVEVVLIEDANGEHEVRVAQVEIAENEALGERAFRVREVFEPRSCAERVRKVVGIWAQNQIFSDNQSLNDIIRGRPCDGGQAIALSQALRAEFGVSIDVTCQTSVTHIIRRICG